MYLSEKPRPIDFYKPVDAADNGHVTTMGMAIEPTADLPRHHRHHQQQQQIILPDNTSSSGDEQPPAHLRSTSAPQKKRAETWSHDETRALIGLRREIDSLFNTSKSNRHLWDRISGKMREKGFDRSATMCTDKWRNLLKEFKKVRNSHHPGSPSGKMSYFGDLEDLLRERQRVNNHKSPNNSDSNNINNTAGADSKVNIFIQFSENGLGDGNIPFGSGEAGAGPTVDIERNLDHDDDPLALTTADAVAANGVPPWNWRENPGDGGERNTNCAGRVITVKWGVHIRRIGIDGTAEAIKEAIKSTFRLRTNRAFWLVDEFNVTRSFDRSMPLGDYILHVDEGISIKLCLYDESDHMAVQTMDKTLYSEDHFRDFLTRNGFAGLREINGYLTFDTLNDLRPGAMYQGVRV